MMDYRQISTHFSVSPQLTPKDVGLTASQGFKAIINNRPDGESDDQPHSSALQRVTTDHDLEYRYLPVVAGQVSDNNVEDFASDTQRG